MIRAATAQDARAIAEVHVASWQEAYKGLLPDAFLDRLSVARRQAMWRSILEEGSSSTWVVEENGRLLGFVNCGTCRDDDLNQAEVGEIFAIYLLPEAWGQGYGRALCRQALTALKEMGFQEAALWVLQGNEGAINFYEAAGFQLDNASKTEQWDDVTLNEIRYRRAL